MATTTPNYGWSVPTSSDYVAQGAVAIETLGDSVDSTLFTALGGAYPGLRLVKKQTIGSGVATVNVTNAFSSTYESYKIIIAGGLGSGAGANLSLQLGASTANYAYGLFLITYATAATGAAAGAAASSFAFSGHSTPNYINFNVNLVNPFTTKFTTINSDFISEAQSGFQSGIHKVASSYTDFTIVPSAGTLTGGTIYVYGYGAS